MQRIISMRIIAALLACICFAAVADVKLPAIISDNMVLQQNSSVTIWGWANPGEKVTVTAGWGEKMPFIGRIFKIKPLTVATNADNQGNWKLSLETPSAGGPYTLKISGNNEIEIQNVVIGELWVCSGQSNMAMAMQGSDKQPITGGPEDIANSANDKIRLFEVARKISDTPLNDVEGKWVVCSPETVKTFSAVGYYFGRKVNKETGYPVGLIASSWGGTLAEAWTREEFLRQDDELTAVIEAYETKFAQWQTSVEEAKKNNQPEPARPGRARAHDKYASLYNGMIAPLTNMTIKGAIWYQGESNTGTAFQYRNLFPTMIRNWRCDFNNPQMPFYFVQLANYVAHKPQEEVEIYVGEPRENTWAELREAQFMTNWLEYTGMAVAIDIGEANCIHPANKKDVGERLAFWALAKDYGKNIAYSGPLYSGYFIEGDKMRIKFSNTDGGLMSKDGKPTGFAIAGEDRKFVWADAVIDGNDIVVSSTLVANPVAVRYAWDIFPTCNIYNNAGLPASPFRTDDWNGLTRDVK